MRGVGWVRDGREYRQRDCFFWGIVARKRGDYNLGEEGEDGEDGGIVGLKIVNQLDGYSRTIGTEPVILDCILTA